jgi:large subunit ribosomal protein L6
MIAGVTVGFSKQLELIGVGFKVAVVGSKLNLDLGFSHPVVFELPKGIEAKVEKNTITITGADKQTVGQVAAQIRKLRKPEPYKGKGIRYVGEIVRQKAGKAAKAGAK